jgi:hypothetical protein
MGEYIYKVIAEESAWPDGIAFDGSDVGDLQESFRMALEEHSINAVRVMYYYRTEESEIPLAEIREGSDWELLPDFSPGEDPPPAALPKFDIPAPAPAEKRPRRERDRQEPEKPPKPQFISKWFEVFLMDEEKEFHVLETLDHEYRDLRGALNYWYDQYPDYYVGLDEWGNYGGARLRIATFDDQNGTWIENKKLESQMAKVTREAAAEVKEQKKVEKRRLRDEVVAASDEIQNFLRRPEGTETTKVPRGHGGGEVSYEIQQYVDVGTQDQRIEATPVSSSRNAIARYLAMKWDGNPTMLYAFEEIPGSGSQLIAIYDDEIGLWVYQ